MRWSLGPCVTGPRLSWPDDGRHPANTPRHQSLRAPFTALLADGKDLRGGNITRRKERLSQRWVKETVGCVVSTCGSAWRSPQDPLAAQQAAGGPPEHDDTGSIGPVVVIGNWNMEAGAWYTRTVWKQTRVYHGQVSLLVVEAPGAGQIDFARILDDNTDAHGFTGDTVI